MNTSRSFDTSQFTILAELATDLSVAEDIEQCCEILRYKIPYLLDISGCGLIRNIEDSMDAEYYTIFDTKVKQLGAAGLVKLSDWMKSRRDPVQVTSSKLEELVTGATQAQDGVRSNVLYCPFCPNGEVLGGIFFHGYSEEKFMPREVSIASNFTAICSGHISRLRLYNELEGRNSELGLLNRELENFAFVVAHDLKAPLRIIESFAEILGDSETEVNEETVDVLGRIKRSVGKMRRLIDDLMEYSRIKTHQMKWENIDMDMVVRELETYMFSTDFVEGGKAVLRYDGLGKIRGNTVLVKQLLQNMIENSIKYRSGGRDLEVEVGMSVEGDCAEVWVRDNGIGIGSQYQEKVFKIFQRLNNKDGSESSGIGLAFCQSIVNRHGGKIWFESKEGEGTTFRVSIPQ